jgi:hypothetical protein
VRRVAETRITSARDQDPSRRALSFACTAALLVVALRVAVGIWLAITDVEYRYPGWGGRAMAFGGVVTGLPVVMLLVLAVLLATMPGSWASPVHHQRSRSLLLVLAGYATLASMGLLAAWMNEVGDATGVVAAATQPVTDIVLAATAFAVARRDATWARRMSPPQFRPPDASPPPDADAFGPRQNPPSGLLDPHPDA